MGYPAIWPPVTSCTGNITANSDIGGYGVMTGFLVTSFFTMAIALVPAGYDIWVWSPRACRQLIAWLKGCCKANSVEDISLDTLPTTADIDRRSAASSEQHHSQAASSDSDPWLARVKKFENLLGPLCDLQLVTGLSIAIAGFVTSKSTGISFYHEQLVVGYWNVTLNSFWVSRAVFMEIYSIKEWKDERKELLSKIPVKFGVIMPETENNANQESPNASGELSEGNRDLRIIVRRVCIVLSCVIGAAFQIRATLREYPPPLGQWHDDKNDLCYNYRDGSSPWVWIVGILLFSVAVLFTIFEKTRGWLKKYLKGMRQAKIWFLYLAIPKLIEKLQAEWLQTGFGTLHNSTNATTNWSKLLASLKSTFLVIRLVMVVCLFALFWLLQLFLSVWAYGDVEYRTTWLIYLGFWIWNTVDIVQLRVMNGQLLANDEIKWGFGQVLPMALLLSVVYNTLDAFSPAVKVEENLATGN